MKRTVVRVIGSMLVVCLANLSAVAAENIAVTDADRVFENFTREAATVGSRSVRLEVRGIHLEDDDPDLDLIGYPVPKAVERVTGGTIDLLASYGLGARGEIGLDVPMVVQKLEISGGPDESHEGIGDVVLYGKLKEVTAERCAVAGGMEIALPTGSEHDRLGTGDVGVNPFVSTRYQRGPFSLGAHGGYQFHSGDAPGVFNYSAAGIVRPAAAYALRVELSGRLLKAGGDYYNDVVLLPGFEVNLIDHVAIRPTGRANLTHDALDWGLGLGIAAQF